MEKAAEIAPRVLSQAQTDAYWGVSEGTFKKLVQRGLAPAPLNLPGLDRNLFDRLEQDRAIEAARGSNEVAA